MAGKGHEKIIRLALRIGWQGDMALLRQALTHPTFFEGQKGADKEDNQRLEFLGDAVLSLLMGEELYKRYPEAKEGELSKMRAAVVCEASLAEVARDLELGSYLLLGKGSIKNGDQKRDSILADAFEALVGAMYLNMGMEVVRQFILLVFTPCFRDLEQGKYEDYKGLLQQWAQSFGTEHIVYKILNMTGPDHNRRYHTGVYYGNMRLGEGMGSSKKDAEQAAAVAAWQAKVEWQPKLEEGKKKDKR
ncbi:MAG: ribonuclease III [Clostridia bacterium]|nr:ribonuclease III [Clostridia bacterium]MDD4570907.1 ribonuclease III [Clostridia bacterium]